MEHKRTPSVWMGALVGGIVTLPIMALLYLGDQLAGLPFLPFDLFDWIARQLPGGLITFAIDTMVSVINTFNLGETSQAAKTSEQLVGLATFLLIGIVAGAVFFFIRGRVETPRNIQLPGIILGLVVVIPLLLISGEVNRSATAEPILSVIWLIAVFLGWGLAINWAYERLATPATDSVDASATVLDRRSFMVRLGGSAAVITVAGAGLGALLSNSREVTSSLATTTDAGDDAVNTAGGLPNDGAVVQAAPGTRPEYTPLDDHYRIDISSRPPVIDGSTWTLPITGLVENLLDLTLNDLQNDFEAFDEFVTLSCISNRIAGSLISTTKWTGLRMVDLLERVQPSEDAVAIKITGADNFDEYVMLDTIRGDERVMLCYAWDDQPLKQKHGFPIRIYIPDHYGMKQPKWIVGMEFVDQWEEGYWVRRGWSATALVNTTSVVDTVATNEIIEEDDAFFVPIGGIAYAGAKQISKVEVRVDNGDWQEAELRDPLSPLTWVIWRYNWRFQDGSHTFEVRALDGEGELQILTDRGVRPDGATGVHSQTVSIAPMTDA